ncbi:MAG: response regulator [Eubacterium sp.]|nr:response regulator [Eubacterium sp.]
MKENILFICSTKSFMVNAIISNLEKEGCNVNWAKPKVNDITQKIAGINVFLFYLDSDEDSTFPESLTFIKDHVEEADQNLLVYLIGSDEEIDNAYKIMPQRNVTGTFLRPINVKELVENMKESLSQEDALGPKKHILVIDDDATMLATIKSWLEDKYQLYLANSGMTGIALLARHRIDLILLDYEMPVLSGAKVLEMIRSESMTKSIPVMFLTANGSRENVMNVLALKPEKYLLKSMPPEELIANIDEFFEMQKGK